MRQLLDVSDRYEAPAIAVERVPPQRIHQYGVIKARPVESRGHEILDLVEKPKREDAPSDLAIIGRYVLPPEIVEILAGTQADARGHRRARERAGAAAGVGHAQTPRARGGRRRPAPRGSRSGHRAGAAPGGGDVGTRRPGGSCGDVREGRPLVLPPPPLLPGEA